MIRYYYDGRERVCAVAVLPLANDSGKRRLRTTARGDATSKERAITVPRAKRTAPDAKLQGTLALIDAPIGLLHLVWRKRRLGRTAGDDVDCLGP